MINLTLMTLHKSAQQLPARPLPRSLMAALTDCIAQVFDNGLRFETAGLVAGGSFWSLLAGCNQQFKPHCDHSGAVIFLDCEWMNKAIRLARAIGKKTTVKGKRKAVLKWCEEMKRLLKCQ